MTFLCADYANGLDMSLQFILPLQPEREVDIATCDFSLAHRCGSSLGMLALQALVKALKARQGFPGVFLRQVAEGSPRSTCASLLYVCILLILTLFELSIHFGHYL